MSLIREIPFFYGAPSAIEVCAKLREHGLVVLDAPRTGATRIACDVERMMELEHEAANDDAPFLLHLSAEVEPVADFGWVDYLVYSGAYAGCPLRAKKYVAAATHSWQQAGGPEYHLARVRD